MKIDLNWKFKDLAGKELEGDVEDSIHAGKVVAGLMTNRGSEGVKNPVKYFDWGIKLYNKHPIEVDESDLEEIKKFIKDSGLFVLAKAQIIKQLHTVSDKEEGAE